MDDENIKVSNNIKIEQLFKAPKNDYNDLEKENANASLDNLENNFEPNKEGISDLSEQVENSKILNINLKNNNFFEKVNNNKYKKDENRIACFYGEEKSKENSLKFSRSSSVKEKLRESINIDYNKLKMDLLPLNKLDNSIKFPKIKIKYDMNLNKKMKKNIILKNEMIKKYQNYSDFASKKKYFIILFLIGILFSIMNLILSILLILYGNKEVISLFIVLNLCAIFFYAIGIYFLEKNYTYTFQIITKLDSPDKIENSIHRNNIYLFIYFLFYALSYYLTLVSGFTIYKNNIKIDIKSKGYDKNKWKFLFQTKSFNQVLKEFEKVNLLFLATCWLSIIIKFILILFFIYEFNSYQFWKRIIQNICLHFGHISFLLINISSYCFQFRYITDLNEYKMAWVIIGLILMGIIGVIMSFYGFYVFYSENIKFIKIFNYLCILFFIGIAVFSTGAKALGLKFDDYKSASCNHIFKFISEDYLLKNNDCSSKYLSTYNSLNNILCPKERIMINWESTEKKSDENKITYGCIDQSCCLKVYCKLKTGFNYQEIIAFNQLFLYIILFISGKYMQHKVEVMLEEEIIEKFNMLIIFSFNLLIYIICLVIIMFRPPTSKQSILNDIKGIDINKELTIFNKDWVNIDNQNILNLKVNEGWNELLDLNYNNLNISIINDIKNSSFTFEYYDYYLFSEDAEIKVKNIYDKINPYFDYNIYFFSNNTTKINFKSKDNIINSLNEYFNFYPYSPFTINNKLFFSMYCIYSINLSEDIIKKKIENINKEAINNRINYNNIKLTKELILLNYNSTENKSIINLLNNKEIILTNNNLRKNNTFFYINGNVYEDDGNSLIQLYNYYYNSDRIYSKKTNEKGEFSIGPLLIYQNMNFSLELQLNICKIKNNIFNNFEYDNLYNNYSTVLKIGNPGFNSNFPFPILKNISLPKIINKNFVVEGYVFDNTNNKPLEEVYIKLYKGNKIIQDNLFDDKNYIIQEISKKDGTFNANLQSNGQYTLIYVKENYFIESQNIIIIDEEKIKVNNKGLIHLFNTGKIVVKLEWKNNPPDLDLICRFNVSNFIYNSKYNFCYTFFGNKKCINSNYQIDNKRGGKNGSEIIEINTVHDYNYFFYIRKYFDFSNDTSINEFKINDPEFDLENNKDINNDIFKYYNENDDFLQNSGAKLLLYANGIRFPAFIINIPNEDNKGNEYNYWAGFCFNGKEGIDNIKIINKFYEEEPPKNICSLQF